MKPHYLIAAMALVIAFLTSCGPAWKLNRARKLINSAIENGATIDSLRTLVHDTIRTTKIEKQIEVVKEVDTVRVIEKCREIVKKATKKKVQDLQKEICPDTTVLLSDSIGVLVQGKIHTVPVKVVVMSRNGVLRASLQIPDNKIPFVSEKVAVGVSSGYTLWGMIWRVFAGLIIGAGAMWVLVRFRILR
jgi:hypothetical protein